MTIVESGNRVEKVRGTINVRGRIESENYPSYAALGRSKMGGFASEWCPKRFYSLMPLLSSSLHYVKIL